MLIIHIEISHHQVLDTDANLGKIAIYRTMCYNAPHNLRTEYGRREVPKRTL